MINIRVRIEAIKAANSLMKSAADGVKPLQPRRDLTEEEEENVEQGKSQWFPRIFTSMADPLHVDMASPLKNALLPSLLLGGAGAAYGGAMGGASRGDPGPGAGAAIGGIGGALAGLPLGVIVYLMRKAENRSVLENMRGLAEGAVRRDLEADPAYRGRALRTTVGMAAGGGGL